MALTAAHVLLIQLLTDKIITYSQTLARVQNLAEEEARAAIDEAEIGTDALIERLRKH